MKSFAIRKLVTAIVVLGIMAACTPAEPTQDPTVTLAQFEDAFSRYNQITPDMTYDNVVQIMGISGEEPPADILTALPPGSDPGHFWYFHPDGFTVVVTFSSNGTVAIKGFGWSPETIMPRTNARTTVEKYDQIKVGMTYEEVVAILGSPGVLRSSRIQYRAAVKNSRFEIFIWWSGDGPEDPPLMLSLWDRVVAGRE